MGKYNNYAATRISSVSMGENENNSIYGNTRYTFPIVDKQLNPSAVLLNEQKPDSRNTSQAIINSSHVQYDNVNIATGSNK